MSMLFEYERMNRLANDLKKLRVSAVMPVLHYKVWKGERRDGYCCPADDWEDIQIDEVWENTDEHRWYRTGFQIPQEMDQKHVEFRVRAGGLTHDWDATNPQMLFYLNGKIQQAIDINHREVTVSFCVKAGDFYEAAFYAYSGSEPGNLMLHTELIVIDDLVDKVYYDFYVPTESARVLEHADAENRRRILLKLAPAAEALDLRKPYSDTFYESLRKADEILENEFYTEERMDVPTVNAIGHTHIDIAWLWTVAQTREKVLRSFSTVLQLMDQYPDYKFMSSQPILYYFVKEQEPELYRRIKERIDEGRWEVDGAMWLEPDCNLPCGESLVRQLLKGHRFIKEEFGKESSSLWLPDVFGYSAALPQLLKKSGVPYFMTNKLTWNQYNELPNDTFMWKGIDGSEVFVFMPTSCAYTSVFGSGKSLNQLHNSTTYTGMLDPDYALGTFKRFQNKELGEDTLLLYGYGDGGGGPTKEMLENGKRLKYGMPGIPKVKMRREQDYFHELYENVKENPALPSWNGELYFEYHRGTYTSIAKNKRNNRKSEILYEQLETLASIAKNYGMDYPTETIREGWDKILINQFHDIIPGTCIEPVYENTDIEYAKILKDGNEKLQETASFLAAQIPAGEHAIVVFNTLGYERDDIVKVEGIAEHVTSVSDENGNQYEVQYIADDTFIFFAKGLPSVGYKVFYYTSGVSDKDSGTADNGLQKNPVIENQFYRAAFNEKMELISIIEKESGREFLKEGRAGNVLTAYEDRPINWDNWNIDPFYVKKAYQADWQSGTELLENGPVRTTLRTKYGFMDSVIVQDVHFYKDIPRIDFENHADWREHNVLLRVNFPLDINAVRASYEIQFGNVERETTCNHSFDTAKFEVCAHKWADLSENNSGFSLLNDCKYGYAVRDGEMSMSLIKAGTSPNANADIGHHEFTYAIYPHAARWQDARTVEMAYNLNIAPVVAVKCETEQEKVFGEHRKSFISCSQKNCFIEVLKQAEDKDGTILRVYENQNSRTNVRISLGIPFTEISECSLMEQTETKVQTDGNAFDIQLKPYEIKTFRIKNQEE